MGSVLPGSDYPVHVAPAFLIHSWEREKCFFTASIENNQWGNSPVAQWLELPILTAKGLGLIPGWGTKIPHAVWCGQKKLKV